MRQRSGVITQLKLPGVICRLTQSTEELDQVWRRKMTSEIVFWGISFYSKKNYLIKTWIYHYISTQFKLNTSLRNFSIVATPFIVVYYIPIHLYTKCRLYIVKMLRDWFYVAIMWTEPLHWLKLKVVRFSNFLL